MLRSLVLGKIHRFAALAAFALIVIVMNVGCEDDEPEVRPESCGISGRIDGAVQEGIEIGLFEPVVPPIAVTGFTVTSTAADGTYCFGPIAPGTYFVRPMSAEYKFTPQVRTVDVSGEGVTNVDFLAESINEDRVEITGITDDAGRVGDWITDDRTPVIDGIARPGGEVRLILGGVDMGTTAADRSGFWQFVLKDSFDGAYPNWELELGTHTIIAELEGTTSADLIELTIVEEGAAPGTPIEFQEMISGLERNPNPDVTSDELLEMRNGNVDLGFDLFHAIAAEKDGNFALSPFSIRGAFGMVLGGAAGQTESEIAEVMGFLEDQSRTHNALNHFDQVLASRNLPGDEYFAPVVLETSNRMFTRLDWKAGDVYLDNLACNYGAGVYLMDFAHDPDGERIRINGWVEEQTHDRIVDLLPSGSINPGTVWVLVNAVYLKAPWSRLFEPRFTIDRSFAKLAGATVDVPTMNGDLWVPYADGEGCKIADLPLRGGELVATFLLPDEGTYEEFEDGLSTEALDTILAEMRTEYVKVALPKFKIETGSIDLKLHLEKLGMPTPFSDGADFSRFGPDVIDMRIDSVHHSVFVAADEDGIEAAAATAVGAGTTSVPQPPEFSFEVDRPFLFLIRDKSTGLVLFIGRVLDPSQ